MAIINADYDGTVQYTFSTHGSSVVLKQGVVYNYYGFGAALEMDVSNARLLVSGQIYAKIDGVFCSGGAASVDIATTGMIAATGGAAISIGGGGAATINNFGVIQGFTAINASAADQSITVYNSGIVVGSSRTAIIGSDAPDRITNIGTIIGDIFGGGGYDVIDTHLGTVTGTLYGGAGNDSYIIAAGQMVDEGRGVDDGGSDVVYSYGDFTLPDFVEYLYLRGDAAVGRGNSGANYLFGTEAGNRLYGGARDDTLGGGSGDDVLRGGSGDDFLQSYEGADQFFGGAGNDRIDVGTDKATVDGGDGNDLVTFLLNDTAIIADLNLAKIVKGGAAGLDVLKSIEGVWGSQFNDTLTGNDADNNFLGYLGDDTIKGGGGNDVVEGYSGADALDGGTGIDLLSFENDYTGVIASLLTNTGTAGAALGDTYLNFEDLRGGHLADTLTGSGGANRIEGGGGNDVLDGGGGLDTLYGDADDDTLTGGAAKDVFGFRDVSVSNGPGFKDFSFGSAPGGFGQDTITDFQDGLDKISFVGDSGVHSFADLTIAQMGTSTVITVTGTTDQITLLNFNAVNFTSADVIFGA